VPSYRDQDALQPRTALPLSCYPLNRLVCCKKDLSLSLSLCLSLSLSVSLSRNRNVMVKSRASHQPHGPLGRASVTALLTAGSCTCLKSSSSLRNLPFNAMLCTFLLHTPRLRSQPGETAGRVFFNLLARLPASRQAGRDAKNVQHTVPNNSSSDREPQGCIYRKASTTTSKAAPNERFNRPAEIKLFFG
jgi:hypothetical protein